MEKKTSKPNRVVVMGITLIVLLIPFCLYYVFYVSSQQAYFIDRSHRSLAGIGSQIVSRVDGLRSVVQNAAKKGCAHEGDDAQVLGNLAEYFNPKTLKPFGTELKFAPATDQTQVEGQQPNAGPAKPLITLEFKQDGSAKLSYESDGRGEFKPGRFSVAASTRELLTPLVNRFVIRDRQAGGEDLFDKVIVADSETGTVVFEYGLDSITFASLDDILGARPSSSADRKTVEAQAAGTASSDHSAEKTDAGQKANDNTKARKPVESRGRPGLGSSGITQVNIAEADHKLFYQPIQLTVPKAGSDSEQSFKLTVCGLVRSDQLTKRTFSFSYTLLLLAVLLVLITAASGPLIKLRLLGPKDRLSKADVVLTACSAFFATALVTLTLLDFYTYANLENQLDGQLELLAESVDHNLRRELAGALDQLDALGRKLVDDPSIVQAETPCASNSNGSDNQSAVRTKDFQENILNGALGPETTKYPYFNNAMWIDLSGEQRTKLTTRRKHTTFISVEERPFFKAAKEGKSWDLAVTSDVHGERRKLYLDAINSRTSGDNVAVISKLTPNKDEVAALDTRLLSLYQPVLPVGYGFCVIDNSGLVLFDADDVKNLEENFFDECNNNKLLRTAVQLRASESVNLQYLGRAHRAFVTPIKDLPWTLVVFRDRQILRTINLEIVTLVVIALAAYAVLLIAALALIFFPIFPGSTGRLNRIWPDQKRLASYQQMAIVNSVLFFTCLALTITSSRGALIFWALLFPALAIAHSLLLMGKKPRLKLPKLPTVSWLGDWRRSYSLALVSMLALACVAPSLAFFKLMRDEQIRVFIRLGQMSLATGLERREGLVRSQYASNDPPIDVGLDKASFIKIRLAQDLDVYDSFFFETVKGGTAIKDRPPGGLLCWFLTNFSPFYNETCVDSLELVRGKSADSRWVSAEQGANLTLVLRPISGGDGTQESADQPGTGAPALPGPGRTDPALSQESDIEKQPRWILTSTSPGFISFANPLSFALAALVAIMLLVAYFAVRFAARRIVLLDMPSPRSIPILLADHVGRNYLVVSPKSFDIDAVFPRDRFRRIDLSITSPEQWWRNETALEKPPRNLPVVIDRFEFKKDDAALNERKLQLVKEASKDETRRVFIVSALDPLGFPLSNGKPNGADGSTDATQTSANGKTAGPADGAASGAMPGDHAPDVERWCAALGSFARAYTFEQANPQAAALMLNAVAAGSHSENAPAGASSSADDEESIAEKCDQAETYYRGAWSACSREERLTLFRVAQDGLVARFDPDLRRLMQWGLILRDPSLRLMDPSFRRFVLAVSAAEGVNTYRADVESYWDRLKVPLLLILLGVIAFLFLTQKELYDSTISLVSALTGGAFALLKLFGMFQKRDSGAA